MMHLKTHLEGSSKISFNKHHHNLSSLNTERDPSSGSGQPLLSARKSKRVAFDKNPFIHQNVANKW